MIQSNHLSLEQLRPTSRPRVIDLVDSAGIDIDEWSFTTEGKPVALPAANPAYCYEWCFSNDKIVVLNLWFEQMRIEDGRVVQRRNMRDLRRRIEKAPHLEAGTRTANVRRAIAVDSAVQRAFREKLVVRVIVCDGDRRDLNDEERRDPSRVELRLLDESPWRVTEYDYLGIATGGSAVIVRDQPLK